MSALLGIIFVFIVILAIIADSLISYIPRTTERELFKNFGGVLGLPVESKTSKNTKSSRDVNRYLEKIVAKLSKKWQGEKQTFSIKVVDMSAPNAFVIPGGYIFITKGLLDIIKSENGLAMVIGHEMGHQYKRHPLRSIGRGIIVVLTIAVVTGFEDSDTISSVIGNSAALSLLKFSRDQEKEADDIGQSLVKSSYGHVNGTAEFFDAIIKLNLSSDKIPTFLKSHPNTHNRKMKLEASIKDKNKALIALPDFVKQYAK